MNPQKKSIPKSNQTNSKMPYPIPLSMGHNNQKKKKNPTQNSKKMIHREDEKLGVGNDGKRERLGQVACGRACDSGSDHGGLVMAFMSTMVLGLKRRE